MFKVILILAVGIGIGYAYGFSDAQTHEKNVVTRLVERVGGSSRHSYNNDVDAQMERVSH
ncbi:MAG: hypothetical protein ACJ79S_20210 [Gemmatimonadaceae bacterium]